MPIYEYRAKDAEKACAHCADGFEAIRLLSDPPLDKCPNCGGAVVKAISSPSVGASKSGFDRRAKESGFHKLVKTGKGEYQKSY